MFLSYQEQGIEMTLNMVKEMVELQYTLNELNREDISEETRDQIFQNKLWKK